jgi:hypothetical protein
VDEIESLTQRADTTIRSVPPKLLSGRARALLRRILAFRRRRILWAAVAVIVLIPGLTYGLSRLVPTQTAATVRLRLLAGEMDAFIAPTPIGASYLRADAEAVRTLPAAMDAVRLLPSPPTTVAAFTRRARELSHGLRIATDLRDGMLSITAFNQSPQLARLTADAFAQGLLALRRAQSVSIINYEVGTIVKAARAAPARLRASLTRRIALLRVALAGEGRQTEVALPSASSSTAVVNALLALALSLLACAALRTFGPRFGPVRGSGPEVVETPQDPAHGPVDGLVSSPT